MHISVNHTGFMKIGVAADYAQAQPLQRLPLPHTADSQSSRLGSDVSSSDPFQNEVLVAFRFAMRQQRRRTHSMQHAQRLGLMAQHSVSDFGRAGRNDLDRYRTSIFAERFVNCAIFQCLNDSHNFAAGDLHARYKPSFGRVIRRLTAWDKNLTRDQRTQRIKRCFQRCQGID
jgi:hypothetical protein